MIIGIDFGTCFSSVAFMNGQIPVTDYIRDPNKTGIPTLFMYSRQSQKELFGYECTTAEAVMNSADVVRYLKKLIRENPNNLNATVTSGGRNFTINDVVKKYLKYLVAQAKAAAVQSGEFENTEIEGVTITSPVGIADGQMTATDYNKILSDTMAEITGLSKDKVNILQEPVAAAISYLYSEDIKKKYNDEQTVLVFDLGGGTLDVTIVEHNPSTMEYNIRAKEGDLNLGGNDWDEALGDLVKRKTGVYGLFPSEEEEARFKNVITKSKIELTDQDETSVVFKYNGVTKFCDVTREEFEKETEDLLDRAIEVVDRAIDSYDLGIDGIDKIILVGGGSNMPQIRERIDNEYADWSNYDSHLDGDDDIVTHDPSKAIAKGAAVFSKMDSRKAILGSMLRPIHVNDIATCTYGFRSRNGSKDRFMIYNLLFKGTSFDKSGRIYVESDEEFVPLENYQEEVLFVVYESDAGVDDGPEPNWIDFGSNENANGMQVLVRVPDRYLGRARSFVCKVAFSLDTNGILEIIIRDEDGNQVGYDKKQI